MDIRLFNSLPINLKQLFNNCKDFKIALKDFFIYHSFYTLEEYFERCRSKDSIPL
jgi:hypothetical protein